MRRTKILATLGPASESRKMIRELIKAGVDAFRLNQSHGSRAWHNEAVKNIRAESDALGKPIAVVVDLQGPKIRLSKVAGGCVVLKRGAKVDLVPGEGTGDEHTLYTPLPQLVRDVKPGDRVLVDDGNVVLKITSKGKKVARARVVVGGPVSDHKGINLPGVDLKMPAVTAEDLANLRWAARSGVEYVAVSFVRSADDVALVRNELHKLHSPLQIIAKIEKPEALDSIDEIARLADGLMVARGDLGVEMDLEDVPVAQMKIISAAHRHDVPVVVATQMLESMTTNPRPTRAEVSDVAGAIFGTTDAVMLSGETAIGAYPVGAVRQMAEIAEHAEEHMVESGTLDPVYTVSAIYAITDAICHGANSTANDLSAKAVFVATASGRTALLFSKYRFAGALIGASNVPAAVRRMALYWGVKPVLVPKMDSHHRLSEAIAKETREIGYVSPGDTVVFIAGSPLGKSGATNLILVGRVPPPPKAAKAKSISADVPKGRITISVQTCVACGSCVGECPHEIFKLENGKIGFNRSKLLKCTGDWQCRACCPVGAIKIGRRRRKTK